MIENLKARWIIIVAVLIACFLWVLPNFVDMGEDSWLSGNKIVYGLDIQGGLHLVMGVDVDNVVAEKTERTARNMRDQLKDEAVPFTEVKVSEADHTQLQVNLPGAADLASFEKFIGDYYPGTLQVIDTQGSQVTLRFFDSRIREYREQVVEQAIEVIRNRIDEFGVSEPSISAQGSNRILVQLPGIENASHAKELINRTARLTFNVVSDEIDGAALGRMIREAEEKGGYEVGQDGLSYSQYLERLNQDLKDQLPENTRIVFQKPESAVNMEAGKIPFLARTDTDLGGEELEDANVRPDEFGRPEVVFRFTPTGRRKFTELSGENVGKLVAIVLDGVVQSAPVIKEKISSATASISLGSRNYEESMAEAKLIATALRAGALPASLQQVEERTVGPTLGADSIARASKAGVVGAILVLLFMIAYYRYLGFVADIALSFNILMILAILTSLGATLTLPGVAGIVLTIGMAVDANIIIFERIKEELRKGAGLQTAVKDGFGHAFSAIFDANITTAAVCVALMYFGTGPVRGFAVTLLIGIITSMFTALFVSRAIIDTSITRFGLKKLVPTKALVS